MNSNNAAENLSSDGEVPLKQAAFVHSLERVKKPLPARPKISEIRAISKKVMGGKRKKSFSVNLASASETSGIPV